MQCLQGNRYWRYSSWPTTNMLDNGYPRRINEGFPGVPDNLDAAFVWGKHRHIYFIKGTWATLLLRIDRPQIALSLDSNSRLIYKTRLGVLRLFCTDLLIETLDP